MIRTHESCWKKISRAALSVLISFGVAAAVLCLWLHAHDAQTPMDERGLARMIVQTQVEP